MSIPRSPVTVNRVLKSASAKLVDASGGLEAAAEFCRVGKSSLHRYCSLSPAHREDFMPVDVVRCLEQLVGQPIVTSVLVREAEHEMTPLPTADVPEADWHRKLAMIASKSSDCTTAICAALGDGRVCADDVRQHRLIEVAQALTSLGVRLEALCRQVEGEGEAA